VSVPGRRPDGASHGAGRAVVLGAGAGAAAGLAGVAALRARRRRGELAPGAPGRPEHAGELALPEGARHLDVPVRDGGSIHVVEHGAGPPILLVHGITLQAAVWAGQLRDLGPRHRMIALDVRGHGASVPGGAGLTIAAVADDIADVLEAFDLRSVTVAGHSMGGMALLRFLRRHARVVAERVGALAVVSSSGGLDLPFGSGGRLVPRAAELAVAGHRRIDRPGSVLLPGGAAGERLARMAFGQRPAPEAVRRTLDLSREMAPASFVAFLPELARFDEKAPFDPPGVPSVVVVGDRDRLTPPRYGAAVARSLPGSRLVVWRGAGHMLMYERREGLDWLLDELSGAAAGGRDLAADPR